MLVELDIFSGRENPRWALDAATAGRLEEQHRSLMASAVPAPEPPGLGYRGFLYAFGEERWRARAGLVAGPGRVLLDPDRTVERLLLESLPPAWAGLRRRVAGEIDSGPT